MSAEFPEDIPLDDLAKEIAEVLGEREDSIIPSRALKLFNEVRDIEATGGMKVFDGSRRRTPGGVYMVLFKSDPDVPQEIKMTKMADRSVKKGKRRIKAADGKRNKVGFKRMFIFFK
ncbi:unnamed protein product [Enterobius vermicularis]|uniref:Phosphorylated adapter RNA export protein n=1 Tax=Enterobius vermicularis TaxID=51028 RepID=A0A0N4VIL0_ENTVE|nr:unnamed protein product [Enterobius vermicularis]